MYPKRLFSKGVVTDPSMDFECMNELPMTSAVSKILTNSDVLNFDDTLAQLESTTADITKTLDASKESKPPLVSSSSEQSSGLDLLLLVTSTTIVR